MNAPLRALVVWGVLARTAFGAEPVTAPTEVNAVEEPEAREQAIVFRWYDARGMAHDTTDPTTIPPGVKVRIAGPEPTTVDPKKTRRWWRARLARLQAELHAAQDGRAAAERTLAEAVKAEVAVAVTEREPLRSKLADAQEAERKAQEALNELHTDAKNRKIPERWLR